MATRREIESGVWIDSRRVLWLESVRALVVADLHWGYAASHRQAGNLLPIWGDEEIATRLRALVAEYAPAEMIWLGDVIHAAAGRAPAEAFLASCACPVRIVRGNHDRAWRATETELSLERGGFLLHHGDRPRPAGTGREVVGHYHPALDCGNRAGTQVRVPALICEPQRWILPAFSPWSAGTPWNHLLKPGTQVWVVAPRRIFAVRVRERRA